MHVRIEKGKGKKNGRYLMWGILAVALVTSFFVRACLARAEGKNLTIKRQYIEALDLSNDSELEDITIIEAEALKRISIENCDGIKSLKVSKNMSVKEISIKNCPKLEKIEIRHNVELEKLLVENSPGVKELRIKNNDMLRTILLDGDIRLKRLYVTECTGLKSLGKMELSELVQLKMAEVPRLKFKGNYFPRLEYLAYDNSFSGQIDFRSAKRLRQLNVQHDRKKKILDVTKFPRLRSLSWKEGVLENVRFGKKGKLRKINLRNNRLSGDWNMDGFKKLHTLNLSHNRLTSLDMGKLRQEMCIYCADNRLKVFRAWNYSQVPELYFQKNPGLRAYLAFDDECCLWIFDKSAKMYFRYS